MGADNLIPFSQRTAAEQRAIQSKGVKAGIDAEDADTQMLVVAALVQRAIDGDVRAARLILDIMGASDEKAADIPAADPITLALKEEFGEDAF